MAMFYARLIALPCPQLFVGGLGDCGNSTVQVWISIGLACISF